MGYVLPPVVVKPTPTRESFHLGRARDAYLRDEISLDRFEELAHHVIVNRGHLTQDLQIPVAGTADFNAEPPAPKRAAEPSYSRR